jgi:hypothetical protein
MAGDQCFFRLYGDVLFYADRAALINKQTPLEEGELKNAIRAFAAKVGFHLNHIMSLTDPNGLLKPMPILPVW